MSAHDQQLVEEIIPLLTYVKDRSGQWVPFQIDRDKEFQAAVHWLYTNLDSPFIEPHEARRSAFVIEWKTRDGGWTGKGNSPALRNTSGERLGRMRYRVPRKRSHRGPAAG